MRTALSSGHGLHIQGADDILNEVEEARRIVNRTAEYFRAVGVETAVFHDDVSDDQSENLKRITDWHNKQSRDIDVSIHLNAYKHTNSPMGTECLYVTQQSLATEVAKKVSAAGHFINRGPKKRTDLAFLNNTNKPAILIEVFFLDSQADVDLYHQHFEAICSAIATAVSGQAQPGEPPVAAGPAPPYTDRRTLVKGDSGIDVVVLQTSLGLPADGDFGSVTDTQVRAFQAAVQTLTVDGVVGPATWSEVDRLDERMADGDVGVPIDLAKQVAEMAAYSEIAEYNWPDRGSAPAGYIPGMAQAYALAVTLHRDRDSAALLMARAETGNTDTDALAWLANDFAAVGMSNARSGLDTLRHLFVLLIGLGMRESSGKYCEGRDMSATNMTADTCEAGLFQTSWDIRSASEELPDLLEDYWQDPNGFLDTFRKGITPSTNNLQVYGIGDGACYQFLAKYSPAFAVLTTAVGLRTRRQHWGPINRKEVDLRKEVDELLMDVQDMVSNYTPEVF